jgi:hypothetical protein
MMEVTEDLSSSHSCTTLFIRIHAQRRNFVDNTTHHIHISVSKDRSHKISLLLGKCKMMSEPEIKNADGSEEIEEVTPSPAKSDGGPEPSKLTYKEIAKKNGMNYTVTEIPPLWTSMLLGLQHYLTMLGATVLTPLIICPAMGADGLQTAEVIGSIFFVSGINTVSDKPPMVVKAHFLAPFLITSVHLYTQLLQTTIGDRLPIVQGGSFSYLPATFQIIFNSELQAITDPSERFEQTMRTIQGAIIVSGLVQIAIGYTGVNNNNKLNFYDLHIYSCADIAGNAV